MHTLFALVQYLTFITQIDNDPLNDWASHLPAGLQGITYLVGRIITG